VESEGALDRQTKDGAIFIAIPIVTFVLDIYTSSMKVEAAETR